MFCLHVYMCALCVHCRSQKKRMLGPLELELCIRRWMWTTMWVLRVKPGFTERAELLAISPASSLHSLSYVPMPTAVFSLHVFVFVNTSESEHKQAGVVPIYLPSYFFLFLVFLICNPLCFLFKIQYLGYSQFLGSVHLAAWTGTPGFYDSFYRGCKM